MMIYGISVTSSNVWLLVYNRQEEKGIMGNSRVKDVLKFYLYIGYSYIFTPKLELRGYTLI